jgi:N-acyl-D-amino-acid deacylase
MGGYGQMKQLLAQLEGYRKEGLNLLCDCYPYSAFSTVIGATTYDEGFLDLYQQKDYSGILIVNGEYAGQRCTKEIYDVLRMTAPDTATVAYFMKDDDIDMALLSPMVMVGSDGLRKEGRGHPRASGTFPRFIKNYIKTGKISLIDGLAKMTSMPAERLQLPDKGNLCPGSDADVVIFDLDEITDCATFEDGQLPPQGIDYVFIGGEIAAAHGCIVNYKLGKCIRR